MNHAWSVTLDVSIKQDMNLVNGCELIMLNSTELEGRDKDNMQNNNKISFINEERIINKQ